MLEKLLKESLQSDEKKKAAAQHGETLHEELLIGRQPAVCLTQQVVFASFVDVGSKKTPTTSKSTSCFSEKPEKAKTPPNETRRR